MSDIPTQNSAAENTTDPVEMSGARALWTLTRKFWIGSFAIVGAFAIGMIVVIGMAAALSGDDYDDDPYWDDAYIEPDDGFFGGSQSTPPAGGGGLFPDQAPVQVEPRPTTNAQPVSIEYRVDTGDNSIELRGDGACDNDVSYSIYESDGEIRVSALGDTRFSSCSSSDWVTIRLNNPVGDRIVVNAEAGFSARPVLG